MAIIDSHPCSIKTQEVEMLNDDLKTEDFSLLNQILPFLKYFYSTTQRGIK